MIDREAIGWGASSRNGYLGHVSTAVADLTGREPRTMAGLLRAALIS